MQQEWSANVVRELWPLGFSIRVLLYGGQSDLIGGEFWAEGNLGSIECRAASSAAHIYGKKQVSAESYTASGKPFLRYPGELKKRGDWSFTSPSPRDGLLSRMPSS